MVMKSGLGKKTGENPENQWLGDDVLWVLQKHVETTYKAPPTDSYSYVKIDFVQLEHFPLG